MKSFWLITTELLYIQACGGIIVAATLKYADNILKTFSNAISVVLSCLLSYLLLGDLNLAPTFLVGATIIILASLLYGRASAGNRILQFSVSNLKLPMKNKNTILPLLSMVDSNKSMQDKAWYKKSSLLCWRFILRGQFVKLLIIIKMLLC